MKHRVYMFLSLSEFLGHFPIMKCSKDDFVKNFRIMYSKSQTIKEILSLEICNGRKKPLIKKPDSDVRYQKQDEMIEYFYEIIIRNRHKYLECFYHAYFEFKDPRDLKWKNGPNILTTNEKLEYPVISIQKNDASKRIVRNLFYLDLLDLTKVSNTVKSKVSFWRSLVNMFNKLELEDRFFAPSSIDLFLKPKKGKKYLLNNEINYNNLFYLFQAYQPKASIFNPYSIYWILENIIDQPNNNQGKIFTPVMSWCSYLIAFMHSTNYSHYVGVDVMKSVCDNGKFLGEWYQNLKQRKSCDPKFNGKKVEIYRTPSQNLLNNEAFLKKYTNYFNTVIICPPYFDMEIYDGDDQSIDTFPDYEDWLTGYFEATVKLCSIVLKKGGTFAMIANDYYSLDGDFYPLTEDLDEVATKYFNSGPTYYLQNRTSPLRVNSKKRTERLFIYKLN